MMWLTVGDNDDIGLAVYHLRAFDIAFMEEQRNYGVMAYYDGGRILCRSFATRDEAKNYLTDLIKQLNDE